ncbi:GtrA family protein [Haloarcula salina]|uniref:GtrA family protein n=1 Tax=Haloarcula salina TaxID=1429914 RepID=A0AA41G170_9EURY|nr:GtrA family protein [Haloarcula salina]MBV0901699.1 GtrA family protein [Haloarcula salina]
MASAVVTPARRQQLVRFFLVGLLAALVQTALLWTFVTVARLHYLVAGAIAIEITILLQYVLNNAWTFHRSAHSTLREYLVGMGKTNLVRVSALLIQLGILYVFVTSGAVEYVLASSGTTATWQSSEILLANAGAIALTGVYRYALDAYWTWG